MAYEPGTGKLQAAVAPLSRERYSGYRGGEVETITFEDEDTHSCFGIDANGDVWDFELHGSIGVMYLEGKLDEAMLQTAQKILDEAFGPRG